MSRVISILLLLVSGTVSIPATVAPSNALNFSENVSLPFSTFNLNVTNITLPHWYAGLSINLIFDRRCPLNILSFFNLGVRLMYDISRDGWEAIIPSDSEISEEDDVMGVLLDTTVAGPLAQDQLKIGYAILALFQTLTTMLLQNQLYKVESEILVRGYLFGNIRAMTLRSYGCDASSPGVSAPKTNESNRASSLRSGSGQIIDEQDANFKITYTYDSTRLIHSQDLFMAFLDGLANAAEPNEYLPCRMEQGIGPMSATGQGAIRIYENPNLPGSMSYEKVKRGLYLVWNDIMLRERRYCNMDLILEYAGVEIGTFWIDSIPPPVGQA